MSALADRATELLVGGAEDIVVNLGGRLDRFLYNLDAVHPGVHRLLVSARTGEGIQPWCDWLAAVAR